MKINHNYFSELAFNLAENNLGKTKKNPSVGCVIVKNNSVISSGITSINGRPHAEYNALNQNLNFNGSNMYVTLEPCTHYGLTPPCTDIIKKKKIKKVYYSFNDPDPRINNKTNNHFKRINKSKKIKSKFASFYESYFYNKKNKFPLIDGKLAVSKDYFTINMKSKWITNIRSRQVKHLIRSKYDCIISTSETINSDDALLNCRIHGLDNNKPDLIIIDRHLKLKKKLKLFSFSKKRKIFLFTCSKNKKRWAFFKKKNIKILSLKKLETRDDFDRLFKKIFQLGKGRVLIETGLVFLNKLFEFNFLNNLYLFKTKDNLGRKGFNKASSIFIKKLKLKKNINVNLEKDKLFKIRIKKCLTE